MTRNQSSLALFAGLLALACFDEETTDSGVVHPTLIGVAPEHFLGGVPCLQSPGAMQSYAATIFDVTEDLPTGVFEFPSSSLVSCYRPVTFSFVVPGHRYVATVRGYDRDDLETERPGSPYAVDSDGQIVEPRWTTQCGKPLDSGSAGAAGAPGDDGTTDGGEGGEGGAGAQNPFSVRGVTSTSNFTVYAGYCQPLVDKGPVSDTGVSVGLERALYALECGSGAGQVAEFTAELVGAAAAPSHTACDDDALFTGLSAGQDYQFEVLAFESGVTEPRWQTRCRSTALTGTITPANCDPLTER